MYDREETIEATLEADGALRLSHAPSLPPGPVRVTIRPAATQVPGGVAEVLASIAASQRARGFPGRTNDEIQAELDGRNVDDDDRDAMLSGARLLDDAGTP